MRPKKRRKKKALTKSEQMARVRNKDTKPESILRKYLWKSGLRYRIRPNLPGTPDIAFMGKRTAIFVDGCFWHGCPEHYTSPVQNADFWNRKLERNMSRDRRVDVELASLGWEVIRVWEHEIYRDIESVVERIHNILMERNVSN